MSAANQYGYDHGNPVFWAELCAAMQERIDAEPDPQEKGRLQAAQDLICRVRDKTETL